MKKIVLLLCLSLFPQFLHAAEPIPKELDVAVALPQRLATDLNWIKQLQSDFEEVARFYKKHSALTLHFNFIDDWKPDGEKKELTFLREELKQNFRLDRYDLVLGIRRSFGLLSSEQTQSVRGYIEVPPFSGYGMVELPKNPVPNLDNFEILGFALGQALGTVVTNESGSIFNPAIDKSEKLKIDHYNSEILARTRFINFKKGISSLGPDDVRLLLELYEQVDLTAEHGPAFFKAISEIYQLLGEKARAVEMLQKAVETHPTASSYLELGKLYLEVEQTTEALESFRKAEELAENSNEAAVKTEIWNWLATFYYQSSDYEQAYQYWQKSLELDPNSPQALLRMGILKTAEGDVENGIKLVRRGFMMHPSDPGILAGMAAVHRMQGNYKEAIDFFLKSIKSGARQTKTGDLSPLDIEQLSVIYAEMGLSYAQLRDFDNAVKSMRQSCQLNPSLDCRRYMGEMYFQLGDWDKAISELSGVIQINQEDVRLYGTLGAALARKGDLKLASNIFKNGLKYAKTSHESSLLHSNLGNIYRQVSQNDLALQEFQLALVKNTKNIDALLGLAVLYKEGGEPLKAARYISQIYQIDPQHPRAKQMEAELKGSRMKLPTNISITSGKQKT